MPEVLGPKRASSPVITVPPRATDTDRGHGMDPWSGSDIAKQKPSFLEEVKMVKRNIVDGPAAPLHAPTFIRTVTRPRGGEERGDKIGLHFMSSFFARSAESATRRRLCLAWLEIDASPQFGTGVSRRETWPY